MFHEISTQSFSISLRLIFAEFRFRGRVKKTSFSFTFCRIEFRDMSVSWSGLRKTSVSVSSEELFSKSAETISEKIRLSGQISVKLRFPGRDRNFSRSAELICATCRFLGRIFARCRFSVQGKKLLKI